MCVPPFEPEVLAEYVGEHGAHALFLVPTQLRRLLEADTVGILRYHGPAVADSFYQDPDQTAVHFRNGWFYPGDLAEIDLDGYVFLRGRSNDMIIGGGINIYPNEVEDVLMRLPGILECSVLGVPDPELGEIVAVA